MRFNKEIFRCEVFLFIFLTSTAVAMNIKCFAAGEPIKIGVIHSLTGVHGSVGKSVTNGLELYFDMIGNELAGRDVRVIVEDDAGDPDAALMKAKKLVEKDKINILVGPVSTASAHALRPYVESQKLPMIVTIAFGKDLTQKQKNPNIFRVNATGGQVSRPFGWYSFERLGAKKAVVMASDFAAGHEAAEGFAETFKLAGGQVVKEIYPPLTTTDYGPFLAMIEAGKSDAVWAWFAGADAVRFVSQYNDSGLSRRIRLIGYGALNDSSVIAAVGQGAVGIVSALNYTPSLKGCENCRFVKEYQNKFNEEGIEWAVMGFTSGKVIAEATKAVGGKVEDTPRFLEALRKVKFDDPRGPFMFDADQNPIQNVYVLKTVKEENRIVNKVIDTIPEVGQYWPR